ncbi:glycosyl hydrolase 2 galactose-binding domain-containing protein [Undibacterium sp. TJN19]|uniref:glycoside hydrolase family 2 protein n=1 Tax=Undibacterium sp. TJN19 TaxID=3413055 RepID=UPI003BF3BBD6
MTNEAGYLTAMNTRIALNAGWQVTQVASAQFVLPSALQAANLPCLAAQVPGTIASALRAAGQFEYGAHHFDDVDIWFQCRLTIPADAASLCFDGLATHAEIYWNDSLLLRSENMFVAHRIELAEHVVSGDGVLSLHFLALNPLLAQKRPRPRWKTRLVEQQQIRWIRTSLLGRMPGWSPPAAPVGPYRPIWLEMHRPVRIISQHIASRRDGDDGLVEVELLLQSQHPVSAASLYIDDLAQELSLQILPDGTLKSTAVCRIPQARKWWPHTHGEAALYSLQLQTESNGQLETIALGQTGFRDIRLDQNNGDFHLHVNQQSVFCRGVCWTPVDVLSLHADLAALRAMLTLVRDAGMNMLRVVGTMCYEVPEFYRLCDEMGILVWQDFMFANMDYPVSDAAFATSIAQEAQQFLARTQTSPCMVVLCGNSEIEQQAAMLGQPAGLWRNVFFADTLPALCQSWRPDVIYWPSSPSGGVMPFQVDTGVAHYFGVGAYLRPLQDARRSGVRFTSECLGFSNMPDDELIDSMLKNGETVGPHPAWKQGIPRDNGTAWDFEDVRDHYMASLYQLDPVHLRSTDRERYLILARTSTGEVMAASISEWRRAGSACHGALVWFWRDLRPGAGWGIVDAYGKPKAAYYYLKRAMAALTVLVTDEGLNGLALHVVNDTAKAFNGELELNLFRQAGTRIAHGRIHIQVDAHSNLTLQDYALLPHFMDTSYAYRFGPPGHDVVVVNLYQAGSDAPLANAFHFPEGLTQGLNFTRESDLGLKAICRVDDDGRHVLHLSTQKLALAVAVHMPGFIPADNYFHLAPGSSYQVRLHATGTGSAPARAQAHAQAQNALASVRIEFADAPAATINNQAEQ